jgi:hypothetical protein
MASVAGRLAGARNDIIAYAPSALRGEPLRHFLSPLVLRRRTSLRLKSGAGHGFVKARPGNRPALDRTDRTAPIQPTRVTKIPIHYSRMS